MAKRQRVSRLLEMVALLQSGTGWKSSALAERFGVSRTRVFNDIRALREAGVPVRGSRSGYAIDASFFLPSVQLTPAEVHSLLMSADVMGEGGVPGEVRRSAREKLLSCLPQALRASAEELLRRLSVVVPTAGVERGVFAALREAVAQQRRVVIAYQARDAEAPERLEIEPFGMAFRKHAWYVVAHSVTHQEVRTFRLSRVGEVQPTALHFTTPKDFSLEERFKGSWYVFGGEPQEIGLRFSPQIARFVKERAPHPGQMIQTLSDGAMVYRARVRNLDEVAWWVVQYGGDAEVLYPKELREKVVALAKGILRRYGVGVPRKRRAYGEVGGEPQSYVAEPEPPPSPV